MTRIMNEIRAANNNDILYFAKQGFWLTAGKIVYEHLEKTNFKICIHNPSFNSNEPSNQKLYDNAINNIIGINEIPFTQNQKLKLCKFWLTTAEGYNYNYKNYTIGEKND